MSYYASQVYPSDTRGMAEVEALLRQENITKDANLDFTLGLYDSADRLVATGSTFGNTLRCLAVDHTYQGEGLMATVVTKLVEFQFERQILDLFLYTKTDAARIFASLGFYEIARVEPNLVFMENSQTRFQFFLNQLIAETREQKGESPFADGLSCAALVVNCNPITLGHLFLIEYACSRYDYVHLFIVSEDLSLVPFTVRKRLIMESTAHLSNLIYHDSGSYIISQATFPSYFLPDGETVERTHAALDAAVFLQIARALKITARVVGDEPFSQVTNLYNQVLAQTLREHQMTLEIVPRKKQADREISATQVRRLIRSGDIEAIREWVPEPVYRYFASAEAAPVIERIRTLYDPKLNG